MKINIPKGDNFVLILAGLSSSQRELIDILCHASTEELLVHLENFTQWVWEKGDALCWSPVFNRFDQILQEYIIKHMQEVNVVKFRNDDWFEHRLVEAILRVSIIIVENCTSKNYYNSLDRLIELLEDTSSNIVYLSARLISIYFSRNKKNNVPKYTQKMVNRLLVLADSPLPEPSYAEMIEHSYSTPPILDYYLKSKIYMIKPDGYIRLNNFQSDSTNCSNSISIPIKKVTEENFSSLLMKYKDYRFELIRKTLIFRASQSPKLQRTLVNIRFASLISVLLVNKHVFMQFLNRNPSFLFELSHFIEHFKEIDITTMIVATELLSSLIYDGIRYKSLASILGFSSPEGVFIKVLRSYLSHEYTEPFDEIICHKLGNQDNFTIGSGCELISKIDFSLRKGTDASVDVSNNSEIWCYYARNDVEILKISGTAQSREEHMNVLLQLLIAYLSIISYHGNAGALVSPAVLELLVGFLKNRDPVAIPVIIYIVQILESLLEYSQPVCQILRNELDLFSAFAHRIYYDFQKFTSHIATDDAVDSLSDSTTQLDKIPRYPIEEARELVNKLRESESLQCDVFFNWWFHLGERNARIFLLKTILKDLDVFVRSITDFQESLDIFARDVGILPIVKWVLRNPKRLDLGVYASSLTLISDTLNEDPVALPSLISSGLIDDLLDSITLENLKSEDVLSIIPTLICDLFIHPAGRDAIKSRDYHPIPLLLKIVTNGEFVLFDRFGEVSSCIGSSIEEIVRNDPDPTGGNVIGDVLSQILREMCDTSIYALSDDIVLDGDYFERGKFLFGLNERVEGHHFFADRLANLGKFLLRYYRKSQSIRNFIRRGGFGSIITFLHSQLLPPLFMHIFSQHPMVSFLRSLTNSSGPHIIDILCELVEGLSLDMGVSDACCLDSAISGAVFGGAGGIGSLSFYSNISVVYSVLAYYSREIDVYGRAEKIFLSGHPYIENPSALPGHFHAIIGKIMSISVKVSHLLARFVCASHCKTRSLLLTSVKSNIHSHPDISSTGGNDSASTPGTGVTENDLFWVTQCGFAYSRTSSEFAYLGSESCGGVSAREYEIWRIVLCRFKAFLSLMAKSIHLKWLGDSVCAEVFNHALSLNGIAIRLIGTKRAESPFHLLQFSRYLAEVADMLHSIHFGDSTLHALHPMLIHLFALENGFALLCERLYELKELVLTTTLDDESEACLDYNISIVANYIEKVSNWRVLVKAIESGGVKSGGVKELPIDSRLLVKSIFSQLSRLEAVTARRAGADAIRKSQKQFERWDGYERAYHQCPESLGEMEKPLVYVGLYSEYVRLQQIDFQSPAGQSYILDTIKSSRSTTPSASRGVDVLEHWSKLIIGRQAEAKLSFKELSIALSPCEMAFVESPDRLNLGNAIDINSAGIGSAESAYYSNFKRFVSGALALDSGVADFSVLNFSYPLENYSELHSSNFIKRLLRFEQGPQSLPSVVDILTRLFTGHSTSTGHGHDRLRKGSSCLSHTLRLLLGELSKLKRKSKSADEASCNEHLYCIFFTLAHLLQRFREAFRVCEGIDSRFRELVLFFIRRPLDLPRAQETLGAWDGAQPIEALLPPHYMLYALISLVPSGNGKKGVKNGAVKNDPRSDEAQNSPSICTPASSAHRAGISGPSANESAADGSGPLDKPPTDELPPITLCLDILSRFPHASPNLVLKCLEVIDAKLDDPKSAKAMNSYKAKIHPQAERAAHGAFRPGEPVGDACANQGLKVRSALHLLYGLPGVARPRGLLLLLTRITLKFLSARRCKYAPTFTRDVLYWLFNSIASTSNSRSLNYDSLTFILENVFYQFPLIATTPIKFNCGALVQRTDKGLPGASNAEVESCLHKILIDYYFPLFAVANPSLDAIHHFASLVGTVGQRVGPAYFAQSIAQTVASLDEAGKLAGPSTIVAISEVVEKVIAAKSTPQSSLVFLGTLDRVYATCIRAGYCAWSESDGVADDGESIDGFFACNAVLRVVAALTSPRHMAYRPNAGSRSVEDGESVCGDGSESMCGEMDDSSVYSTGRCDERGADGAGVYSTGILNVAFTASSMDSSIESASSGEYESDSDVSQALSLADADVVRLPHEASSGGTSVSSAVSSNSEGSESDMEQVPRIRLAGELDGGYPVDYPDECSEGGSQSDDLGEVDADAYWYSGSSEGVFDVGSGVGGVMCGFLRRPHPSEVPLLGCQGGDPRPGFETQGVHDLAEPGAAQQQHRMQTETHEVIINWDGSPDFLVPRANPGLLQPLSQPQHAPAQAEHERAQTEEHAGLAEEHAGLAEEHAGLAEEHAGLAEEHAGLAEERAGLAEAAALTRASLEALGRVAEHDRCLVAIAWCLGLEFDRFLDCAGMSLDVLDELPSHLRQEVILEQLGTLAIDPAYGAISGSRALSGGRAQASPPMPEELRNALAGNTASAYLDALPLAYRIQITRRLFSAESVDALSISSIENITLGLIFNGNGQNREYYDEGPADCSRDSDNSAVEIFSGLMGRSEPMEKMRAEMEAAMATGDDASAGDAGLPPSLSLSVGDHVQYVFTEPPPHYGDLIEFVAACLRLKRHVNKKVVHQIFYHLAINGAQVRSALLSRLLQLASDALSGSDSVFALRILQHLRSLQIAVPAVTSFLLGALIPAGPGTDTLEGPAQRTKRPLESPTSLATDSPTSNAANKLANRQTGKPAKNVDLLCKCIESPLFQSSLRHSAQVLSLIHFCLFGESTLKDKTILQVELKEAPTEIDRGDVSALSAGLILFKVLSSPNFNTPWTVTYYGPNQHACKTLEALKDHSQQRLQVAHICSASVKSSLGATVAHVSSDSGKSVGAKKRNQLACLLEEMKKLDLTVYGGGSILYRLFLLFMDISLVDACAGRALEPFFFALVKPLESAFKTLSTACNDTSDTHGPANEHTRTQGDEASASAGSGRALAVLIASAYLGITFRLVAREYACTSLRQLDDVLSSTTLYLSDKMQPLHANPIHANPIHASNMEGGDKLQTFYSLEKRELDTMAVQGINYWVPKCHIAVVDFCETHKLVLNELVRNSPTLLHGGLEALVRLAPFTLNFENKRFYFRQKLKEARVANRNSHNLPFTLLGSNANAADGANAAYDDADGTPSDGTGANSDSGDDDLLDNVLRFNLSSRHEPIRLNVRREHVFMDSYHQLRNRTAEEMKGKLSVTFIGEEGVDAGGLTKEWFSILAREMFNPNYALFTREGIKSEFNHPNPLSAINPDHLNFFRFIGRVIGKAIYDSHHLDAYFCRSFYKHMLRRKIVMADAESVDPEFYNNLKKITCHKLEDLGLELYFSAEIDEFGKLKVVDLIPDGRNILVTEDSKMEYVRLMCQHKVSSGIQQQLKAFLEGFYQLIPPKLIAIFDDKELELLISGVPTIDLDDLIANVEYSNYNRDSPQIVWLWSVLRELDQDMLASFLQFVTGTSRVPIGGFKFLMGMRGPQKMSIHKVSQADRLPTAHTCFNQLDLPCYPDVDTLRLKLLLALTQGKEGFGFI